MKERLHPPTTTILCAIGLWTIAHSAFSEKVRKMIGQRDGWKDVDTGESFFDGFMVHASHFIHDRTQSNYNSPENGRMQTVANHLKYHLENVGQASKIGLSEMANNRAIELLKETPTRTKSWLEAHKK